MKSLILAWMLVLVIAAPAIAGRNADGAMVVHTNDALSYTSGVCDRWETEDDPGSCESALTRTDHDESTPALIWLVAAFMDGADPSVVVVYFGLDHNLPDVSHFASYGFCGPAGSFDIPDGDWPVGGGNSVAFGTPVAGDLFFPFYYVSAYGFSGAYLGTGINPTGGYAGFVDDGNPPILDLCAHFGRVRWYEEGMNECPAPPIPGACCLVTGECVLALEAACAAQGGIFQGEGVACDPDPCADLLGACCFPDGHCEIFSVGDCGLFQGLWQGPGALCEPNPCAQPPEACCVATGYCTDIAPADCLAQGGTPQGPGTVCEETACRPPEVGACCFEDGSCAVLSEEECAAQGGIYLGSVPCEPDPCIDPVVQETSWGRIKAGYR